MMKKKEFERKFRKLSPTNKIRYNLGMIRIDMLIFTAIIVSTGYLILSMLFLLPFIYAFLSIKNLLFIGFFLMFLAAIIVFVGIWAHSKINKKVDKFLNENQ